MFFHKKIDKRTEKRKVGDFGENIACKYLKKRGFTIREQNYLKKYGEIDIIAEKGDDLHFVEVKSVTRRTFEEKVSPETDYYRPEENITAHKFRRLNRVIQVYLEEKRVPHETSWQIDGVFVEIDENGKVVKTSFLENINL